MKKIILFNLFVLTILACSFTSTPTPIPTSMSVPTSTPYAGKWYGESSTEEITPKLWTPVDGNPEAYAIRSNPDPGQESFNTAASPSWEGDPFVQEDGKTFLKIYDSLFYWPSDLNPAMLTFPPPDVEYVNICTERYIYNAGYFFSVTKVSFNKPCDGYSLLLSAAQ